MAKQKRWAGGECTTLPLSLHLWCIFPHLFSSSSLVSLVPFIEVMSERKALGRRTTDGGRVWFSLFAHVHICTCTHCFAFTVGLPASCCGAGVIPYHHVAYFGPTVLVCQEICTVHLPSCLPAQVAAAFAIPASFKYEWFPCPWGICWPCVWHLYLAQTCHTTKPHHSQGTFVQSMPRPASQRQHAPLNKPRVEGGLLGRKFLVEG